MLDVSEQVMTYDMTVLGPILIHAILFSLLSYDTVDAMDKDHFFMNLKANVNNSLAKVSVIKTSSFDYEMLARL